MRSQHQKLKVRVYKSGVRIIEQNRRTCLLTDGVTRVASNGNLWYTTSTDTDGVLKIDLANTPVALV